MSPSEDKKKKPVGFRFDPELENFLQLVSDRSGMTKTVLVEQSLGYYFADRSDPMLERRREFVLSVVNDLVEEGCVPAQLAPGTQTTAPEDGEPAQGAKAGTAKKGPASSAVVPKGSKARGEAAKHAQRMIAARLKRRGGSQ